MWARQDSDIIPEGDLQPSDDELPVLPLCEWSLFIYTVDAFLLPAPPKEIICVDPTPILFRTKVTLGV